MGSQERIICRLCLNICDSFEAIEGELRGVLDMVLRNIDLTIIKEPILCTYCAATLTKYSRFKTTCLNARNCIPPVIDQQDDDRKLNLKEGSKNGVGLSESQVICGFCMSPVKRCSATSPHVEGEDITLQNVIQQCFPELDFSIVKKLVICAPCRVTLENCFCFVTNCSIVEEKIVKYRETQGINGEGQIELNDLLEFMTGNVLTKVKKEDADTEEIANGVDILRVEQMLVDVKESFKVELELKNESSTETDGYFIPENMLSSGGNIKMEISELPEENIDVEDQLNEEIVIKTEECNLNRFKGPQCSKGELKIHSLMRKDPSEIIMYKCETCSYQTKCKEHVKRHLLTHKDPSEIIMYKCETCSYQTKCKEHIKRHLLRHKDPSEVTMYKCDSCSFQSKYRNALKTHTLRHKDPSEVTMLKCDLCPYQTVSKYCLKSHALKHMNRSELKMYKCDYCPYQTNFKSKLTSNHMLKHKDPSEIRMYKCDLCAHQTKTKSHLKTHLLVHKDPSEVTMYKCETCFFQTKRKKNLDNHLLLHKDLSEVTMYKCDSCSFKTKHKTNINRHSLRHMNSSTVTLY